jgi:hypothetical protein
VSFSEDRPILLVVHYRLALLFYFDLEKFNGFEADFEQKRGSLLIRAVLIVLVFEPSTGSETSENGVLGGQGHNDSVGLVVALLMKSGCLEAALRSLVEHVNRIHLVLGASLQNILHEFPDPLFRVGQPTKERAIGQLIKDAAIDGKPVLVLLSYLAIFGLLISAIAAPHPIII